jgi:enoyl-CoA hydratase
LTGEEFDTAEAHRIGLVQEVVEPGWQLERAIELAGAIAAKSALLGVKTTLASAHRARLEGETAAYARLDADMLDTEDGREGPRSFVERREARSWGGEELQRSPRSVRRGR